MNLSNLLAITLYPEWIYAILYFGKRTENRTWRPPARMLRQWIALHGGSSIGGLPARSDRYTEDHAEAARDVFNMARLNGCNLTCKITISDIMRCRGIVALGYLDSVREPVKTREGWQVPEQLTPRGVLAPSYGWHFSDLKILPEPIAARGMPGLWPVQATQLEIIKKSLASN